MSEARRIKTALVSVYHKEGLDEIITKLHEEGVQFLSTGGTRQFIESQMMRKRRNGGNRYENDCSDCSG